MRRLLLAFMLLSLAPSLSVAQQTDGPNSPIITNVQGNVTINYVTAATEQERLVIARQNIRVIMDYFESVLFANGMLLTPAMVDYMHEPTAANWATVQLGFRTTLAMIEAAMIATARYSPGLEASMIPQVRNLLDLGRKRNSMIAQLMDRGTLPTPEETGAWRDEYQELVEALEIALTELHDALPPDPRCPRLTDTCI